MRYILLTILSLLAIAGDGLAAPACRIQRFDEGDGLSQWHVTQMTQDRQGMMWFSTWNGLCRFDGYVFKSFKGHVGDGSAIATDRMRSVWLAPDGNLTCKVDDGLYRFSLKTCRFEQARLQPQGKNAVAVKADRPYRHRDAAGVVWTVYYDGRLTYAVKGKPAAPYTGPGAMQSARFCMPDRQGNLWVVAADCIYRLSFPQQRGTIMSAPDGAEVKAFLADSRQRYWIATKEDCKVRIFDSANRLVGYLAPDGRVAGQESAFACPVYCMTQTSDGTIWLGSKPGGLLRLTDTDSGMRYRVERVGPLSSDNVYDIKEDRWGRLWVATLGGGICCIPNPKARQPKVLTPKSGLRGFPLGLAPKVRMIHITKDGILLAATTDGLLVGKLTGGGKSLGGIRFRLHRREADRTDALSCSATMNIAEDSRGRIFVSTESGGVNMIKSACLLGKNLSFRHFGEAEGLPTDVALCVMPFGRRMLVVSSSSLVVFSPDGGSAQQFGKGYFLTPCRFSEALPVRLPDGRWMFGMKNGLFAAASDQLRKSAYRPNIALTALSVQGKEKDFAINAADTLLLGSRERSLTIQFAALDYSAPENVSYAFALAEEGSGEKPKWNFIGHDHSATLLDLEPGTYQLLIRSTNADGTWVKNTRRLTIIVTPTFWETTAARIVIALLLMAAVAAIAYTLLYIRRINKQRREVLEAYLGLLNAGEKQQEQKLLSSKLSDEDDRLMRRMSAFVEEHLSDAGISVGDMAAAVAMSRSALQRRLKQIAGVTPLDFLREARQKRAEQLLSETAMAVSEVAFACGYSDPKYFSRTFKASTGKSPTEWRMEMKNEE